MKKVVIASACRTAIGKFGAKIYKSLSAVRETLPKDIFVQCHRCYIVSLYAVRSIRRFEITLNNHEIIPVSKYSYRNVQEQLQQYAAKWF